MIESMDLDQPAQIDADTLVAHIRDLVLSEVEKLEGMEREGQLPDKIGYGKDTIDGRAAFNILRQAARKIRGKGEGNHGGGGATPAASGGATPATTSGGGGAASARRATAKFSFGGLVDVAGPATVAPIGDFEATDTPGDPSAAAYLSPLGTGTSALPPVVIGTPIPAVVVP